MSLPADGFQQADHRVQQAGAVIDRRVDVALVQLEQVHIDRHDAGVGGAHRQDCVTIAVDLDHGAGDGLGLGEIDVPVRTQLNVFGASQTPRGTRPKESPTKDQEKGVFLLAQAE